jgi:hypothetical protein
MSIVADILPFFHLEFLPKGISGKVRKPLPAPSAR